MRGQLKQLKVLVLKSIQFLNQYFNIHITYMCIMY